MEKNIEDQIKEIIIKKYPSFKKDILDLVISDFTTELFKDQQTGLQYMQYYLEDEIIQKFDEFIKFYAFKCEQCNTQNLHYYPRINVLACAFC